MYSECKNMLCVILIMGEGGMLIAQLQAKCTMCRDSGVFEGSCTAHTHRFGGGVGG